MIEVPPLHKRPPGVTAKQWRLAVIYPRAKNAYQALVAAGYSPLTADRNARQILGAIGVERATTAIIEAQREQRDSARSIKRAVVPKVSAHVKDGMALSDALAVWATASKIEAEYPDDDQHAVGDGELEALRAYIRRVVRAAIAGVFATTTSRNLESAPELSDELIDSIAVAARSVELTDCTLPDVAPPTPQITTTTRKP
jgi:phage terminase small subunit